MRMNPAKALLLGAMLAWCAGAAEAAPVSLTWNTTFDFSSGGWPGTSGEAVTVTFVVDNGGTSTLSQTWSGTDFVSYAVTGASGWSYLSTAAPNAVTGGFVTDASGAVTGAGIWYNSYTPSYTPGSVAASWSSVSYGAWYNNGGNSIAYLGAYDAGLNVNNVSDNQIGASWTAALVSVPEPTSLALLGAGLLGLGFGRRRAG